MTTPSQLETVRGETAEIKVEIVQNEEALAAAREPADKAFLHQWLRDLDKKEIILLEHQNRLQGQLPGECWLATCCQVLAELLAYFILYSNLGPLSRPQTTLNFISLTN